MAKRGIKPGRVVRSARIRRRQIELDLSSSEVAARVGIHVESYRRLLRGNSRASLEVAFSISKVLAIELGDVVILTEKGRR